jgi:mono/diheme cytochrome c family protein
MLRMRWWPGVIGIAIVATLLVGQGQQTTPAPGARLIPSLTGKDLYSAYCASCHGVSGRGDGPMATHLKHKPADLTAIAANHGGIFPKDDVRRFITGEKVTGSHGSRQMPVWGPIFSQVEIDTDYGKVRLENLVNYIQSMQGKR